MSNEGIKLASRLGLVTTILAIGALGCADGTGVECRAVQFALLPSAGGEFTVTAEACTHSPAEGECHLEIFELAGDDRYFQYGPQQAGNICAGIFEGQIEDANGVYFLNGTVLRQWGTGTGPFATGTYSEEGNPNGGGSFAFHEGGFNN
jgi:hypothetical protein